MALISRSIPSLINGISQQPAVLRLPTQGEAQENGFPSIVEGLKKRPPTTHEAKLSTTSLSNAHVHTINRDSAERYKVFVTPDLVRVFDLAGVEQTVNVSDFVHLLLDFVFVSTTSAIRQIHIPTGTTTIDLTSVGLDTSDEVVWEKSSTGAFAGEETTVRTDTVDTDASVAWTSGDFLRADYTRVTSTAVTASTSYKSMDYFQGAAKEDFKVISVADFTFIVNRSKTVAMTGVTDGDRDPEGIVHIQQAVNSQEYRIYIDGVEEAFFTSGAPDRSSQVASELKTDLDTNIGADYDITLLDNIIYLFRDDGANFSLRVEDSFGNQVSVGVKDTVQKFTDLPPRGIDGFKVKIVGTNDDEFSDFWVEYSEGASGDEGGKWIETVAPGIDNDFDATTMPHTLVREANGTFTLGQSAWGSRVAGDELSAPEPTFVGRKINDVYFFRNRLGFVSDENVIMSEQGDFFNLWPVTVTTLLDTDRIDVAGSTNKVAILQNAVPHNERLLLFSEQAQFVIDPGDVLSPRSVAIVQTTEFEADKDVRPVVVGRSVYFPQKSGNFSRIREMFVDNLSDQSDAADVTSHVPKYVPKNLVKLAGSSSEDLLLCLSGETTEDHRLYVYKFLFGESDGAFRKVQSAWSQWSWDSADLILNVDFIDNTLYLVIERSDGVYLESMDLQPGLTESGLPFLVHLDRKTSLTGSYSAGTDTTTWTLPYSDAGTFEVILGSGFTGQEGDRLSVSHPTNTTVTATGDFSAAAAWVGRVYTFSYTLSEQFVRESNGNRAIASGNLKIRTLSFSYADTGFFKAKVTPEFRTTYEYPFTGAIIGQTVIGTVNIDTGIFKFPIGAKSSQVSIELENDSPLPCAFLNGEWEGLYVIRSRRR